MGFSNNENEVYQHAQEVEMVACEPNFVTRSNRISSFECNLRLSCSYNSNQMRAQLQHDAHERHDRTVGAIANDALVRHCRT